MEFRKTVLHVFTASLTGEGDVSDKVIQICAGGKEDFRRLFRSFIITKGNYKYLSFRNGGSSTENLYYRYLSSKIAWIGKLTNIERIAFLKPSMDIPQCTLTDIPFYDD